MGSHHHALGLVPAIALGMTLAAAGCGGGDSSEASAAHSSSTSHTTAAPAVGSFSPGPGPSGGGGGGGFSGGGGSGGGGGGHGRLGGIAGILHGREVRRREAIERAHRGPVRLTGLDDDAQRAADWASASSSSHPITSTDDDQCERLWAQHVATTEAYHATRHDGVHSAISDADQRHFLQSCRQQTPQMQQCLDHTYFTEHHDECTQAREQDPTRQRMQQAARASRDHQL